MRPLLATQVLVREGGAESARRYRCCEDYCLSAGETRGVGSLVACAREVLSRPSKPKEAKLGALPCGRERVGRRTRLSASVQTHIMTRTLDTLRSDRVTASPNFASLRHSWYIYIYIYAIYMYTICI
jgi:hypothetical protein